MNGKNEISILKMVDVIPTPDNPRHIITNDLKVKELAGSILKNGLLSPIICRPHPKQKGKYDLRAGVRRYLAHQTLGLPEIMAIVRDMDDKTAMEITVLENLQRENLTPLEEARGIQALMKIGKDIKIIAAEIGKHPVWVIRRAKLTNLSPKWIKAIEDPTHELYGLSAAFLDLIARFDHMIQDSLLNDVWEIKNCETVKEFEKQLAGFTRRLKLAPWKMDNAVLVAKSGACDKCIKRSSHQPGLFDDDLDPEKIKKDDTCLDKDCWAEKMKAWLAIREADLRKEHPGLIRVATEYCNTELKEVLRKYDYEKVKKSEPGAKPAVIVHGTGEGQLIWIKPNNDTRINRGREIGEDGKVKPLSLKEKREQLRKRRVAWVLTELQQLIEKTKKAPKIPLEHFAALTAAFGASADWDVVEDNRSWNLVNQILAGKESVNDHVWKAVSGPLGDILVFHTASDINKDHELSATNIAAILGLKFDDLLAQAAKEIPEPKSWTAEKKENKTICCGDGCTTWVKEGQTLCERCKKKSKGKAVNEKGKEKI